MKTENYESHLVGLFMQMWGRREGMGTEPASLLNNAQNPFDHLLGDICGEVRSRYFLMEFKESRKGFYEEVKPNSAKPHRTALYAHLKSDLRCRRIARFGHFAGYLSDETNELAFEPYAHSIATIKAKEEVTSACLQLDYQWEELEYRSWTMNFNALYDSLHTPDLTLFGQSSPWLFASGLGVPEADLEEYVKCMYSHLQYMEQDEGVLLLGALNPVTGKFHAIKSTPFQMVADLMNKFESLRRTMEKYTGNDRNSGSSFDFG